MQKEQTMKRIINYFGKGPTVLGLTGALLVGLSATAFSPRPEAPVQKVKLNLAVDETQISRDSTENSYAPSCRKLRPA